MATNGGAWEAMKFGPSQPCQPPIPKPPLQRPQTATRPCSMADRRAAVPAPAALGPAASPAQPGAQADLANAALLAAELDKCAARQPWMAGRRQLPAGGR
eukprot:s1144_g19.t1